jgi:hypothetical protein
MCCAPSTMPSKPERRPCRRRSRPWCSAPGWSACMPPRTSPRLAPRSPSSRCSRACSPATSMPKRPPSSKPPSPPRASSSCSARKSVACNTAGKAARVTTDKGATLDADLLLVAAGVAPVTDYLAGSGVDGRPRHPGRRHHAHQRGWHLGRRRRRPGERLLRRARRSLNGVSCPSAVEQGRIAGMAMAGDPALKPYPGGVPLNTYHLLRPAGGLRRQPRYARGEVVRKEADAKPLPEDRHARTTASPASSASTWPSTRA